MIATPPTNMKCRDFDLFGVVGVRVMSEVEADFEVVEGQLGPIARPLNRTPDIVVRFTQDTHADEAMTLVGSHECGFTADRFVVLRGRNKASIRVEVPFEDVGGPCELVCQSGLKHIPLLIEIINLTALTKGALPLHASAFEFNGHGVLCVGWAQGGKTETLLGFMAQGARYIGDEWVYVLQDRMFGIPEPMHVWDWHVDDLPEFRRRLPWRERVKMRTLRLGTDAMRKMVGSTPGRTTRRLISLLDRQRYLEVMPDVMFDTAMDDPSGHLDHVLFVVSHDSPEYRVEETDCQTVIASLAHALEQERSHLLDKYRMFRFAFPDRSCQPIIEAARIERELLSERLGDRPAHIVYHPYPMSPSRLFDTISPLFETEKLP